MKTNGAQDGGGGSDEEGEVVGGGAMEGGKRRVWEGKVPVMVKERAVKAGKNWRIPFVGPSVEPIHQRELEESKSCKRGVERRGKRKIEIIVILVTRRANEVEVPNHEPGEREERAQGLELDEKLRGDSVISGGVNVRDGEGEVGEGGG
jgi:hypothetical protein